EFWEQNEILVDNYEIEKAGNLIGFVMHTQTLRDTSFLVIEIQDENLEMTIDSISYALNSLNSFSSIRPVFLLQESDFATRLAGELANKNIRNVIIYNEETSQAEMYKNLEECLSENGKSFTDTVLSGVANGLRQNAIDNTLVNFKLPQGATCKIAIAGTKHCAGTTTQCFAIGDYLTKIGLDPLICITDNQFYNKLKIVYDLSENLLNVIELKKLNICDTVEKLEDTAVTILDLGILNSTNINDFKNADIRILVSSGRTWDIGDLYNCEVILDNENNLIPHLLWFNFISGEEWENMREWEQLKEIEMARLPYFANPFNIGEMVFYHTKLLPVLKTVTGYVD
ncbi:MAG: hypothetical protein RR052_06840, partial [Oscillospiraceae bacterium]